MRKYVSIVNMINEWTGKIMRYSVLALAGMIFFEVVSRYVFDTPTIWAHETAGLLFGAYMLLVGGYCLIHETHVRVEVFWSLLSRRYQALTDLCTSWVFFVFLILLMWQTGSKAWKSIVLLELSPSMWHPPVWPLKIIATVGVSLLLMQAIAKFIRDLYIVKGKGLD